MDGKSFFKPLTSSAGCVNVKRVPPIIIHYYVLNGRKSRRCTFSSAHPSSEACKQMYRSVYTVQSVAKNKADASLKSDPISQLEGWNSGCAIDITAKRESEGSILVVHNPGGPCVPVCIVECE